MRKVTFLTVFWLASITLMLTRGASGQLDQAYRIDDRQVEQILRQIEKQSDRFRKSLDSALDKSRFNNSRREDDINAFVRDFDNEVSRLRDRFNRHKSAGADVQLVLDRATRVDQFMRRNRLNARAQNDWSALRSNLDQLAQIYNVSWRWDNYIPSGLPVSEIPFRLNDKEVEKILQRIEHQSDKFRSSLDTALDRSRLNGTRREDDINAFVKDFSNETKRLREHFNNRKSTSTDVQSVLDRAARIDQFMSRYPLTRPAQKDWSDLKLNLDELARAYNVIWNWSGYVSSERIPVDQPVVATIEVAEATNRRGYRISLARDGRAQVSWGNSLTTRFVDQETAERFFADLAAARPLSRLDVDSRCFESASIGRSIYVSYANERSPNLNCQNRGPRAQILQADIAAIASALNLP